jgi:hypothetical protein
MNKALKYHRPFKGHLRPLLGKDRSSCGLIGPSKCLFVAFFDFSVCVFKCTKGVNKIKTKIGA